MRLGSIRAYGHRLRIPSILAVYATRAFLVPALPDPLFTLGGTEVSKSLGILVLFALLMLAASFSTIRKESPRRRPTRRRSSASTIHRSSARASSWAPSPGWWAPVAGS